MTDTATARYGARQQSQGSNTNTWGDDKLNEVLRLFDRGSKGVQTLVLTGNTTLSWTNYTATNDGQCAVLKLAGSLSAPAVLIVPSVEWTWDLIGNATGQTVTVKTAAGTGVSIPAGRGVPIYCDGADCANRMGAAIPSAASVAGELAVAGALSIAGKISGVAAGTAATDAVNKTQMETALATAGLPATAGAVLNSSSDTTAGYLAQKITMGFSTATTTQLSGLLSVQLSTKNAGSNEKSKLTFGEGYVGGFLDGGVQAAQFTPARGTAYDVDCTAATVTVNLGGMTSVQIGHEIKLNHFGNFPMLLLGTVNGQSNMYITDTSNQAYRYTGASWGWN